MAESAGKSAPCQQAVAWVIDYQNRHIENLQSLLGNFVNPLREWVSQGQISGEEIQDMFSNVDDVLAASHHTLVRLREAASAATTVEIVTGVACALSTKLLDIYSIYVDSYPLAEKMAARCKQKNERFGAFLNVQQRNTQLTFDRLIRQPLDCVGAYVDVLKKVATACREKVPELTEALNGWERLATDLFRALKQRENEEKITDIELSFLKDDLRLLHRDADDMNQLKQLRARRRMSGGGLLKFMAQEAKNLQQLGAALKGTKRTSNPTSEYEKANGGIDLSDNATDSQRMYIRESNMRVLQEEEPRKRYLFLFNDLVLVAKPRGHSSFTLKTKFKFKNSWMFPGSPRFQEAGRGSEDLGFVIGGPHQRDLIFYAKSAKEKRLWLEDIAREMSVVKRASTTYRGKVSVYPFIPEKMPRSDGHPGIISVETNTEEDATAVVARVLAQMGKSELDPRQYKMWELNKFGVQALEAFENPLVITNVGLRIDMHNHVCQFVLRQLGAAPLTDSMLPPNLRMTIGLTSSPRKTKDERLGHKIRDDILKRSTGMFRVFGGRSPKSPAVEIPDPASVLAVSGKLYGLPLCDLITDQELPVPIQDMLRRLYTDGPTATGLFRKSANARMVRQVRERLDSALTVDFSDVPILAVGSILKEFLRSLPECLFPLKYYEEFIKTNGLEDGPAKINQIKETLTKLPESHLVMLRALMPMLFKIMENQAENSMTARNLGICIGQSMMWPAKAEDVLKNDVPPFIEYLILNCKDLMGDLDNPLYHRHAERRTSSRSDDTAEWESDFDPLSAQPSPCPSPVNSEPASPVVKRSSSPARPESSPLRISSELHPVPPPRTKSKQKLGVPSEMGKKGPVLVLSELESLETTMI